MKKITVIYLFILCVIYTILLYHIFYVNIVIESNALL